MPLCGRLCSTKPMKGFPLYMSALADTSFQLIDFVDGKIYRSILLTCPPWRTLVSAVLDTFQVQKLSVGADTFGSGRAEFLGKKRQ
jgi:hypothetical protein